MGGAKMPGNDRFQGTKIRTAYLRKEYKWIFYGHLLAEHPSADVR
jgi:hypothetical protein